MRDEDLGKVRGLTVQVDCSSCKGSGKDEGPEPGRMYYCPRCRGNRVEEDSITIAQLSKVLLLHAK
jgi:DnaJ-class molecular chaperone